VIAVLAGKWSAPVLQALHEQPLRYNRLLERLPGVSRRMLTATLQGLARDGLVDRRQLSAVPKRVQYSLTLAGEELIGVLDELERWERRYAGSGPGRPSK
jgi:DNA-binding HxlR family transcriptional regulator